MYNILFQPVCQNCRHWKSINDKKFCYFRKRYVADNELCPEHETQYKILQEAYKKIGY